MSERLPEYNLEPSFQQITRSAIGRCQEVVPYGSVTAEEAWLEQVTVQAPPENAPLHVPKPPVTPVPAVQ